mgnify:CR=1
MTKTVKYIVEWNDWNTYRGANHTYDSFATEEEAKAFFKQKRKRHKCNPRLKMVTKEIRLLDIHSD